MKQTQVVSVVALCFSVVSLILNLCVLIRIIRDWRAMRAKQKGNK